MNKKLLFKLLQTPSISGNELAIQKMLIEELCIEIEDNGTNDDLINSLQYAFYIYCIICDKYNIFTLNANGLYNEFIQMLKKNYMN